MSRTPFACTHSKEDVKTRFGAAWYSFPCDLFTAKDDYAYVRLVAPWGFSLGSHVILDGLESHTAGSLKRAGLWALHTIFSVFIHNGSLNSFLHDYGVRALESHSYLSVVGRLPGHVLPKLWLQLIATRSQHSAHSPKKKILMDRHKNI